MFKPHRWPKTLKFQTSCNIEQKSPASEEGQIRLLFIPDSDGTWGKRRMSQGTLQSPALPIPDEDGCPQSRVDDHSTHSYEPAFFP